MGYDTPEAGSRAAELLRLRAEDDATDSAPLPEWARTLVVHNPLDAPVFLRYDSTSAAAVALPGTSNGYDVVCPGAAMLVFPIPSDVRERQIIAAVDYAGAVPAGDAGFFCTVSVQETAASPSVGPLA